MAFPNNNQIKGIFHPTERTTTPLNKPPANSSSDTKSESKSESQSFIPSWGAGMSSGTAIVDQFMRTTTGGAAYTMEMCRDLIDSLQKPPPQVTAEYVKFLKRVEAFLGKTPNETPVRDLSTGAQASWKDHTYTEQDANSPTVKNLVKPTLIGPTPDSDQKMRNESNRARNNIFSVMNEVAAFVSRAKNAGYAPIENPFVAAMMYNVGRVGFTPVSFDVNVATRIIGGINTYMELLKAEKAGKIDFNKDVAYAAQLGSATFSMAGLGGSGDTALDLLRLLPSIDDVKAKKANDALSVLDFSKRIPKMIFTASYSPTGVQKGILVGWKKVPDASGYVIRRTNIFDGKKVQYVVRNSEIAEQTKRFSQYVNTWVLSFYDNVDKSYVLSFLDADIEPHAYYKYTVTAFQNFKDSNESIFSVETSPAHISQSMKQQIRAQMEALDPGAGQDTISPYPVLSHFLLGDSKFDWLLAALNISESIRRNDSRITTRSYSYLAAQLDFLFTAADNGKLVIPKSRDVSKLIRKIRDSISTYGVNQVIKDTLRETGALFYFEGKEANDNYVFKNVGANSSNEGLVSIVAAAIDPETSTLNAKSLATNLPTLLAGEFVSVGQTLASGAAKQNTSPTEIEFPSEFERGIGDTQAEDKAQFIQKIGNLGDGVVDLTTVDGIGTMMRIIRIFSDIGPGRGAPLASSPKVVTPDPIFETFFLAQTPKKEATATMPKNDPLMIPLPSNTNQKNKSAAGKALKSINDANANPNDNKDFDFPAGPAPTNLSNEKAASAIGVGTNNTFTGMKKGGS